MAAGSVADGHPLVYGAVLAQHVAAPLEAAVALLDALLLDDVVAAAAAQRRAVVHAAAGAVAAAAARAREVEAGVPLAEVGRLLVEEQLRGHVALADPAAPAAAAVATAAAAAALVAVFDALAAATSVRLAVPRPAVPLEAARLDEQRQAVAQIRLVDHDRLAEALLERVADQPEFGRRLPARLQLAAARHAVTFAAHLHLSGDGLRNVKQSYLQA